MTTPTRKELKMTTINDETKTLVLALRLASDIAGRVNTPSYDRDAPGGDPNLDGIEDHLGRRDRPPVPVP